MKLCLAGTAGDKNLILNNKPKYMLESFYYIKDWQIPLIKSCELFLLDSGAFTFMNSCKSKVNFDAYLNDYIKFINDNDVKYFFELDIDAVVGLKEVERLRNILEFKTGKKCIPVWHKSRGLKYFEELTKNYSYIAIGGFVVKEITKQDYKYIPKLLDIARKNNCKVHGLGFTSNEIKKYKFYSVDSTTWLQAHRFGELSKFNGKEMIRIITDKKTKKGKPEILEFNLKEWIKYQDYASKFL